MLKSRMSGHEVTVNSAQLAADLGLTLQMLSKYVQVYSQLTKQKISKVGRRGRHFSPLQVEVITNARNIVATNTGVTVEEAMRKALVFDSDAIETQVLPDMAGVSTEKLSEAFRAALAEEVTAPLVAEIQALRAEVAELKNNRGALEVASSVDTEGKRYSPLVQMLRGWLGVK